MSDGDHPMDAVGADLADRRANGSEFRVLRRVRPMRRTPPFGVNSDMLCGCALDVETTGLDHRSDDIIELAVQRFWADETGRIVATGNRRSWLEAPSKAISREISSITGIRPEDVVGRSINEGEATCLIADAHFVISHNASFDRPFVEKRLPRTARQRWACTLKDVDWRHHGFEGRVLGHLLMQMGWFYPAHRAQTDVDALLHLLDHPLAADGTVLKAAVARASTPTWRVAAVDAPYSAKASLRERGYRWDADARVWCREIADESLDEEIGWAVSEIYAGRSRPRWDRVTWRERYAAA